jgi:hypothetical protein
LIHLLYYPVQAIHLLPKNLECVIERNPGEEHLRQGPKKVFPALTAYPGLVQRIGGIPFRQSHVEDLPRPIAIGFKRELKFVPLIDGEKNAEDVVEASI